MKKNAFRLWILITALCLALTGFSFAQEDDGDDGEDSPALVHEHTWSEWDVIRESGCESTGLRKRECTSCGEKEQEKTPALGHEAKEWKVVHEPNCQRQGRKDAVCAQCGKKMQVNLPRTDHDYGEWEVTRKATEFSKGTRSATCRFCGTTKRADIYPWGTMAEGLENDPEAVKILQAEMADIGAYNGLVTGNYDYRTGNAVRKLEGDWGLERDGIAWPGFLRMLGLPGLAGRKAGEAVTMDPGGFKIQLEAVQTSPEKPWYAAGDKLTYEWTVTNASTRNTLKDAALYRFSGRKPARKTDKQLAREESMAMGASVTGTFTYTVTAEDAAAGIFAHGLQVRGKLSGVEYTSNTVVFVNASSEAVAGKKGWTAVPKETLTVAKTLMSEPGNGFFFTEGETIRIRTEIRNGTGKTAENVRLEDSMAGEKAPGTLEAGDVWTFDELYRISIGDAEAGEIRNTARIIYTGESGETQGEVSLIIPTGDEKKGIYVRVSPAGEPANGEYYAPGEKAEFRILIVNLSGRKTFTDLKVYDLHHSEYEVYRAVPSAAPGASAICYYSAAVTSQEAAAGSLVNRVKVTCRSPEGQLMVTESNACAVPCGTPE